MKKYLSSAIAFVIMLGTVQSQHTNIGIKGGLNGYTVKGNSNANYTPKLGLNLGVLAHIHLSKKFALQPEIVFSVQGTKYTSNGKNVDLQLKYVNIPILFQYMFENGFRLELGPQVGILTGAKNKVDDFKTNVNSSFKSVDLGLAVGMSYVRPATGFGFDIRYNHGLTNINTNNTFNTFNRGVQVGLFYLFQHKA
ncbi:MAG: porin family protein [Bacteroidota bacterium]|nr:porin family protein [Bacteroidota bacterium]